ncbi:hypothetical protein PSV08DRAFT_373232 [Bipolaris maydis]|uniref:uncharacterized protein n=1 Tax=Cochliobolus heterostrophus TaxID=5016 RepID=UPI0024D0FA78|nr:hypothetical protein PSV08DRAFT_373232 [Bipolaris maydis]
MSPITTTSPSLFSRAHRPAVYTQKQLRGFLALPGEIRNQIYKYYFDQEHHCEVAAKGSRFKQREPQTIKLCSGISSQQDRTLQPGSESYNSLAPSVVRFSRSLVASSLQHIWTSSADRSSNLAGQAHAELVNMFFIHPFSVLFLSSERFGTMTVRNNLPTMFFCHFSRYKACEAASKKLINLQQLQIRAQIHDCAPKFSLREKWTRTNGHVDNITRWSKDPLAVFLNNQRLARASTELHGAREEEAMAAFNAAWEGKYKHWKHHLQFAQTGW